MDMAGGQRRSLVYLPGVGWGGGDFTDWCENDD
jgi:hypothetical protein